MEPTFSIVIPTRDRPDFIRAGLQVLGSQDHPSFEVVISDNWTDPSHSCEDIVRAAAMPNVSCVRPPSQVGMVDNWRFALDYASGEYILYLTDKMFVLPGALGRIESALLANDRPDIISWTCDAWNPDSYEDYLGPGAYVRVDEPRPGRPWRTYAPRDELSRRGRAAVARSEMSPADYARGKLLFGAYRRTLIERVRARHGHIFHTINPDYTSMVLGLGNADTAVELSNSCVLFVDTDLSNGRRSDTDDRAALAFLDSLEGGSRAIGERLPVPGVYASVHNWVAHDYLAHRSPHGLSFDFDLVRWLAYIAEDIRRPGRQWSSPEVGADQVGRLDAHLGGLQPATRRAVDDVLRARADARDRATHPSLAVRAHRMAGRVRRRLLPNGAGRSPVRRADSMLEAIAVPPITSAVAGGPAADSRA